MIACLQLAACCRSLGLTFNPGPLEVSHAADMARAVITLLSCLAPVGGPAQPSPRPQDLAVVEGLVQSEVLPELTAAIQRLLPKHVGNWEGACGCCRPEAPAWRRMVSVPGRQPRVSVSKAASMLLHLHLAVPVRLNSWLESASAAAAAPQGQGQLTPEMQQRMEQLHLQFIEQLVWYDGGADDAALVLQTDWLATAAGKAQPPEDGSQVGGANASPDWGTALPPLSNMQQYRRVVALKGVIDAAGARASGLLQGEEQKHLALIICGIEMLIDETAVDIVKNNLSGGMAMNVEPGPGLPLPISFITHCMRSSLWWLQRAGGWDEVAGQTLGGTAIGVLRLVASAPAGTVPESFKALATAAALEGLAVVAAHDSA